MPKMNPMQQWVIEYNRTQPHNRGGLKYLERETGLAWSTVNRVVKSGGATFESAELLSTAMGGAVSTDELQRRY